MTDTQDVFIKGEPKDEDFGFDTGMTYYGASVQPFGSETFVGNTDLPQSVGNGSQSAGLQQQYRIPVNAPSSFNARYQAVGSHSHINSNLSSSLIQDDDLLEFINLDPNPSGRGEQPSSQSGLGESVHRNYSSGVGRIHDASPHNVHSTIDHRNQSTSGATAINGRMNEGVKHQQPRHSFHQVDQTFSHHDSPIGSWQSQTHPLSFRRPELQGHSSTSQSHSPVTPKTPAAILGGMPMSAPVTQQLGMPVMRSHFQQAHGLPTQNGMWDDPSSFNSYVDSPLSSPAGYALVPTPMSDLMLKGGKHGSLPASRLGPDRTTRPSVVATQAEQKRKRRRESHNQVERRRRDNINERIQELSHLIPHHRLEDDKVRKHLQSSSPLSPSVLQLSMSPSFGNAQLGASAGRRANVGTITTGIPPEDKEKGPNKGDILNGSVAWTRDLMWALYSKLEQEQVLQAVLARHGEPWPFQTTEEDDRMRAELIDAVRHNGGSNTFAYTRGPGSGLRVPTHTNLDGSPLVENGGSNGVAAGANQDLNAEKLTQQPFWSQDAGMHDDFELKEEDEYGAMDMTGL